MKQRGTSFYELCIFYSDIFYFIFYSDISVHWTLYFALSLLRDFHFFLIRYFHYYIDSFREFISIMTYHKMTYLDFTCKTLDYCQHSQLSPPLPMLYVLPHSDGLGQCLNYLYKMFFEIGLYCCNIQIFCYPYYPG
jgi:hypothetical protein